MPTLNTLENIPEPSRFKAGDYFVLFGELFGRGYANGLVNMAQSRGMNLISMTMGRRDKGVLRPLRNEEQKASESLLQGKVINIPLEAGFDMDAPEGGKSPVEIVSDLKFDNWENFSFNEDEIQASREEGTRRFVFNLKQALEELAGMIQPGRNVYFAHTMAGGFPRAKILLALANRVFKGRGNRWVSSSKFWNHSLGQFVSKNFREVTAFTFTHLIQHTERLRATVQKGGGRVYYSAYGYHGTEILIDDEYAWQTYTPYLQGEAKMELEKIAHFYRDRGLNTTVFNCPEIRTNSSDLFSGVELPLFPILNAFQKEGGENTDWVKNHLSVCEAKLKEGQSIFGILTEINDYLKSETMRKTIDFPKWPMQNSPEFSELMLSSSERMTSLHSNPKDLISDYLSTIVLNVTGNLIFNHVDKSESGVTWLGHKIVAKQLAAANS